MSDRITAVLSDTETIVLDDSSEQSGTEILMVQEEIRDQLLVTNQLLGTVCAFLFFFSVAAVCKLIYLLIRNNVTNHIR